MSTYRYQNCMFPLCEQAAHEAIDLPLCGRHARHVYLTVKELIERSPLAERYSITVNKNNGVRPRPLAGQRRGTVYFMRFGDLIKIGYSADLRQRLKALRPDSVLATMPGTMQDERALHARFGPLWDHGEYFRAEPELMAYIDEVRATQDTRQPA